MRSVIARSVGLRSVIADFLGSLKSQNQVLGKNQSLALPALWLLGAPVRWVAIGLRSVAILSTSDFLLEILKPLHTHINDECSRGTLRFVQERFAKICLRSCLSNLSVQFRTSKDEGPKLIVGSMTSEQENLDTLMHIIVAQNIGWDVTYVGGNIPHDELIYIAIYISSS